MILNLYKQRGETPLERIQRYVEENPNSKGEKMTYLGRLDPLAEGVLLVATGEDVHRKEEFLNLNKEYEFVAVFGFSTDSYDVLGKVLKAIRVDSLDENELRRIAMIYKGEREQKYPPFSSKTINGKPLHELAKMGILDEEDLPSKKVNIYNIELHKVDSLNTKEFFGRLLMDIGRVKGDFRQNSILVLWKQMLEGYRDKNIFIARFSAHVSSGTYIRGLVNDLGNTLGTGATTLSIKRTRVGDYRLEDSVIF